MRRLVFFMMIISLLFAHEEETPLTLNVWEQLGIPDPANVVVLAGIVSAVAIVISLMIINQATEIWKKTLFVIIALPIALATVYLAGTTVYLNTISETGGPVHWHADYEIWACGEKINVIDPTGLDNKVGAPLIHEHNDDRIHVEGVVYRKVDHASLGRFFSEIGGELEHGELIIPTNEGIKTWKSGELCSGRKAELQVFVYRVTNPENQGHFEYTQQKVEDFETFVLAPYSNVPPGDCIIIEFGENKQKTEHLCSTYRIATEKGEMVNTDGS